MSRTTRMRLAQLLVALAALLALSVAYAGDATIVYYDVAGNTANALRRQLNEKGPLGESGKRFDAYTHWYVNWRYRYRPTATGCEFTNVTVSVTGTITLPRRVDESQAPELLEQDWNHYLAALHLHEHGHYVHGLDAAREIEALGRSFHAAGDCGTFVADFNRRARAITDRYAAMDKTYDRDTDHGRTQGAVFP
ncbi:MAG TPA: DUF922 domain-containing Zn-dependent protease [Rhodanobacteraceae bacterium]|nr:DUF922 domain-containing Zn-dependent protease [Rhodanobacteraceae bacterium]